MEKQNGLVHEKCPSCGAKISVGSRALAKKIRCPKCRLVVVVSSKAAPEPASSHGVTGTIPPAEYSREAFTEPAGRRAGLLDEKQKSALLRHLGGNEKLHITISAPANDPDALMLSHALQKLFRAAGWNTLSCGRLKADGKQGGLALYTGPWPFPEEITKSCMALTAAGLRFSSHIDPCQVREKAILVVSGDLRQLRREEGGDPKTKSEMDSATPDYASHPIFEELGELDRDKGVWKTGDEWLESWLERIREAATARAASRPGGPDGLLSRGVRLAEVIAAHLSEDPHKKELSVLRELNILLRDFRNLETGGQDGTALPAPPAPLMRRCVRLVLAMLNEGPGDAGRRLPGFSTPSASLKETLWVKETPWVGAVRFADAVFAQPPISDDRAAQNEFESLLTGAMREGEPDLQRVIAMEVRAWHWFRTPERRALHDELFYQKASCESVTASAFGRLAHWPPSERERVFRRLLQREDKRQELAEILGNALGWESILLDTENNRLPAADLAREAIEKPASFPFLASPEIRREFLRHFVIGMTEAAKRVCGFRELADDFADWSHRAWLELNALEGENRDPRGVVLFVSHWLGRQYGHGEREVLRHWWLCVSRMLVEVIRRGNMNDIFTLFATLRDGGLRNLATVDELFEFFGAYLDRIEHGPDEGVFPVEADYPDENGQPGWREVADCIADILAGLLDEGRLVNGSHMQLARRLLLRLATECAGSRKAADSLLRFEMKEPAVPPSTPERDDVSAGLGTKVCFGDERAA